MIATFRTQLDRLDPRIIFIATCCACTGLLAFGYYLQFVRHLEPCPMCIFQRLVYFGIAGLALVAAWHRTAAFGTRLYAALLLVLSMVGAGIAGRQTWLQHLPADRVPECGPGLEYLFEVFPVWQVLRTVLKGTGDCAKVDWTLLGLSIAEWSLMAFAGFALLGLAALLHRSK